RRILQREGREHGRRTHGCRCRRVHRRVTTVERAVRRFTHAGAGLDVDDTDPGFGGQLGAVDAQRAVVLERPVRLRRVGVATGPVAPCNVRLQGEAEAAHVAAHAGLYAHGPRVVVVW